MIKQLSKALSAAKSITDWLINETTTHSIQAFYVMQKLETIRLADTLEYSVTVYKEFSDKGVA